MIRKLTAKQERFAQVFIETGNASEAYRAAYNAKNMKPVSVHVNASKVLNSANVSLRVQQLREEHAERHRVTVDSLTEELEQARRVAFETKAPAAAVSATMGKAKLHGLLIDKQQHTGVINLVPVDEDDAKL